jgi:hypothetical protein
MAADTKTKPGPESVPAFIKGIADDERRADAKVIVEMMGRVTGEKPKIWGGDMVGFGQYHYRYPTGREGDALLVGFSPRAKEFSIYLMGCYFPETEKRTAAYLKKLGKHRMGKACLYVKRLADIDVGVLEDMTEMSVAALRSHYPAA